MPPVQSKWYAYLTSFLGHIQPHLQTPSPLLKKCFIPPLPLTTFLVPKSSFSFHFFEHRDSVVPPHLASRFSWWLAPAVLVAMINPARTSASLEILPYPLERSTVK